MLFRSAERVDAGRSIETADTVFAGPGDVMFPSETREETRFPSDTYDRGVAVPLAGSPFGLAALSTPTASVGGQEANPLVDMPTTELLQHDAATGVLADAGITDAAEAEWLAGPEQYPDRDDWIFGDDWDGTAEVLGTETDLEAMHGVVSGDDGPWGTVLFVARVTDDDHVPAVGAITRPVGTVDGGMTAVGGSGWGLDRGSEILPRAAAFAAGTMGRLERR